MSKKCCGKWKKKGKYCKNCPAKLTKHEQVKSVKIKSAHKEEKKKSKKKK